MTGTNEVAVECLYACPVMSGAASPDRWETAMSVDPGNVNTLSELVEALQELRQGRSYTALTRAAALSLGLAPNVNPLPSSTLSDLFRQRSKPSRETMTAFLAACGLNDEARLPWLAAWERTSTAHLARPGQAVRVREARPRLLGVHAAIRVDDAPTELPAYVPRDIDADLRTAVTAAAKDGGFVLLVGGSSVGKTRALFEVVQAVLPDWWLIHPASVAAVSEFAAAPTPRIVVWLDELQRYFDNRGGLTAAIVRESITAGAVIVATLWPHEYSSRVALPVPGQPDPHCNDRQVLDLAQVIDVPDQLSAAERRRAEALTTDQRIRIALDTPDAGFTQVLAAGPELIRWWETAADPYGKAIITAALDARRVGAQAPLSRDLLAAAAAGYLTSTQQASAPTDWFDRAIAYATTQLHGATATLCPVAAGIGVVAGYTVADYLHQHARQVRRTVHLPEQAWQALTDHHHPSDTIHLASSAARRGRYAYAETLYRFASDAGDPDATEGWIDLLAEQGRVDELRQRADAGNSFAAQLLADLLVEQGRLDELRQRAGTGDYYALSRWIDRLAEQGRIDELRHHAGRCWQADYRLADLLAEQGRIDELRHSADCGNDFAAIWLAYLLAKQGVENAFVSLSQRADAGDSLESFADGLLARLLAEQGRVDELRQRADASVLAKSRLVALLAEQGRVDELRQRADAGDSSASDHLAHLLAERGRPEDAFGILRQRAATHDGAYGASWLAHLLAEHGRANELRERADAGDWFAAQALSDLLAERGQIEELRDEVAAGTPGAAGRLAQLARGSSAV
jgi:hypothetical protein